MVIPKTEKLATEEAADATKPTRTATMAAATPLDDVVRIKPVYPLNDNIAILQFRTDVGSLVLPEDEGFKEEGIVIGIGPGIPDNNGGRVVSQLELGDVVSFKSNNIISKIKSSSGPYEGQLVLLISERSLLTKLPAVPFEVVDA